MPKRVTVRQFDEPLTVGDDETILEAALAAGLDYPFGCQSGQCGSCKSVLLEGKVDLGDEYSEFALTDEEREGGFILACQSRPLTNCEVAYLDPDEPAEHEHRVLQCSVAEIEQATHDTRIVRLKIESGGPFAFSPGQFASVIFHGDEGDLPARDYSMASQPEADMLEFHVRLTEGGTVSPFVQEKLKKGDKVTVSGPFGVSYLRRKHTGPIIALAGGSGLSPIKSIIDAALEEGMRQPIHLYFGVRDERDLYYLDHFNELAARHGNFTFTPVLSEPSGETERRTGNLNEVILADFEDLDGHKAYLAGPPIMVETCIEALTKRGLNRDDAHADAFYTEADKAEAGTVTERA